jgi:hypothetical protein
VHRQAVGGVEVQPVRRVADGHQRRLQAGRSGVRHRDAQAQPGPTYRLARQDRRGQGGRVEARPLGGHRRQGADRPDVVAGRQVRHAGPPVQRPSQRPGPLAAQHRVSIGPAAADVTTARTTRATNSASSMTPACQVTRPTTIPSSPRAFIAQPRPYASAASRRHIRPARAKPRTLTANPYGQHAQPQLRAEAVQEVNHEAVQIRNLLNLLDPNRARVAAINPE